MVGNGARSMGEIRERVGECGEYEGGGAASQEGIVVEL